MYNKDKHTHWIDEEDAKKACEEQTAHFSDVYNLSLAFWNRQNSTEDNCPLFTFEEAKKLIIDELGAHGYHLFVFTNNAFARGNRLKLHEKPSDDLTLFGHVETSQVLFYLAQQIHIKHKLEREIAKLENTISMLVNEG